MLSIVIWIWYIVIGNVGDSIETEREGFEPSVNKSLHSSSNATPWTTRPSLLHNHNLIINQKPSEVNSESFILFIPVRVGPITGYIGIKDSFQISYFSTPIYLMDFYISIVWRIRIMQTKEYGYSPLYLSWNYYSILYFSSFDYNQIKTFRVTRIYSKIKSLVSQLRENRNSSVYQYTT